MKEREIIKAMAAIFARSPRQHNATFAADAEILDLEGRRLALTVDDYSAEDRMPDDDPLLLGWNLVTATVSDLLAVGAEPRFMLNSLVVTPAMDREYLRALATGMQEALAASGGAMAGGDIGTGPTWRFTGVALGGFRHGQAPFSRLLPAGARAGAVMVTGAFGDGNLAAAGVGPALRLEMRLAESATLASLAAPAQGGVSVACMDTSDGLATALETMCAVNPGLRIEVDARLVPRAPGVESAASAMRVPPEVFLLGSAGEYELLALVPEGVSGPVREASGGGGLGGADVAAEIAAAEGAGLRRIGSFRIGSDPGAYFRRDKRLVPLSPLPDPREAASFEDYCRSVIDLARRLFDPGGGR